MYDGNLHKCRNCGENLKSFETTCPVCGWELRDASASVTVRAFSEKMEHLQKNMRNPDEDVIINLIRTFPIPNTKEDLFEFLILASSNINSQTSERLAEAWAAKLSQIYQKAELAFGTHPDFVEFQKIYTQANKQMRKQKGIHTTKNTTSSIFRALLEVLTACPGLVLIVIGLLLPRYDDTSIMLIILGGVVLVLMSVYYVKKGVTAIGVGCGMISIGLACVLQRYDDRRTILILIGALIFVVLSITLVKSKQKR